VFHSISVPFLVSPVKMYRPTVLITGCSRGLGLEFVKQLAATSAAKGAPETRPKKIVAVCRKPGDASELREVAAEHQGSTDLVSILKLDVTDYSALKSFVKDVEVMHKSHCLLLSSITLNCIPYTFSQNIKKHRTYCAQY